jgi:hypothetical protein
VLNFEFLHDHHAQFCSQVLDTKNIKFGPSPLIILSQNNKRKQFTISLVHRVINEAKPMLVLTPDSTYSSSGNIFVIVNFGIIHLAS